MLKFIEFKNINFIKFEVSAIKGSLLTKYSINLNIFRKL